MRILLLLAIVICGASAGSQPVIPHPSKAAQAGEPEHKEGNSGPSDKPSEKPAPADSSAQPNVNHLSPEKVWTIFLVPALTLVALGAQVWIYSRQRKLMQSALDLERPYVYGRVSKPGLMIFNGPIGPELKRSVLELCIDNIGRTPANLTRLEYKISAVQRGGIAPAIDPTAVGGRELPVGTIAVSGEPFLETEKLALSFLDEQNDIIEFKRSVWVVGFVRYKDIFGHHHISGFAHVLDLIHERFVRRGGEQYNYARTDNPRTIPPKSE
jgi:hypothetical protein